MGVFHVTTKILALLDYTLPQFFSFETILKHTNKKIAALLLANNVTHGSVSGATALYIPEEANMSAVVG